MTRPQRVLFLGCGSVTQAALPLLIRDVKLDPKSITIIDFVDNRHRTYWDRPLALVALGNYLRLVPTFGGIFLEKPNFELANPMSTPEHIAPVWYFTPFYSMLRAITAEMMYALIACVLAAAILGVTKAKLTGILKGAVIGGAVVLIALMLSIDAKFWGVVVMGGAVIILFFLPWLDHCPVKSIRYRPDWHKTLYGIFVINFVILAYLGVQPPSPVGERVSQVGTLFYFGFFLLMPWWSRIGQCKPVPERVTFAPH